MKKRYAEVISEEFARQHRLGHFRHIKWQHKIAFVRKAIEKDLDEVELGNALQNLAAILKEATQQNVVVLVDNFDEPKVAAFRHGYLVKVDHITVRLRAILIIWIP